jgi:hypothetical protein
MGTLRTNHLHFGALVSVGRCGECRHGVLQRVLDRQQRADIGDQTISPRALAGAPCPAVGAAVRTRSTSSADSSRNDLLVCHESAVSNPCRIRAALEHDTGAPLFEGMDPGNTVPNTSRFHPRFDQLVAPFRQLVRDSSPINRKPIEKRSHAVEFPDRTSGHQVSQMPPTELLRTTGLWSEVVTDALSGCIRARLCENSENPRTERFFSHRSGSFLCVPIFLVSFRTSQAFLRMQKRCGVGTPHTGQSKVPEVRKLLP